MARKNTAEEKRAKNAARNTAQARLAAKRTSRPVQRVRETRREDGSPTRSEKSRVPDRLPGDEPLEIFKVQLSLNDNRQLTLCYNEARDRMITIKTPTALLRLLNGRVKAFFEGRVINKHIQLERMLTDEESEGVAW
jgi:hypothetical protein